MDSCRRRYRSVGGKPADEAEPRPGNPRPAAQTPREAHAIKDVGFGRLSSIEGCRAAAPCGGAVGRQGPRWLAVRSAAFRHGRLPGHAGGLHSASTRQAGWAPVADRRRGAPAESAEAENARRAVEPAAPKPQAAGRLFGLIWRRLRRLHAAALRFIGGTGLEQIRSESATRDVWPAGAVYPETVRRHGCIRANREKVGLAAGKPYASRKRGAVVRVAAVHTRTDLRTNHRRISFLGSFRLRSHRML